MSTSIFYHIIFCRLVNIFPRSRELMLRPEVPIKRAILNSLAYVLGFNCLLIFKVGQRTAHLQYSIVSSSKQRGMETYRCPSLNLIILLDDFSRRLP